MSSVQHHELREIADHTMASIADQIPPAQPLPRDAVSTVSTVT